MLEDPRFLSQEKVPSEAVIGFSRKTGYECLSNFYMSSVPFEGTLYPSVEHAYQAAKSLDPTTRRLIKSAKDPNAAKRLGQSVTVRVDWTEVRVDVMRQLIKEKFKNPFIRWKLKETVGKRLVNENRWNDTFWGVTRGIGENWLGKILEEVREEILTEDSADLIEFPNNEVLS